jgi:bicarbonate transport system substrate-binding protein
MTDFSRLTRRKFVLTAGATAAGSLLLKGCLGNPPSARVATADATAARPVAASEATETPRVKLGYIPIVESAALIVAQQKGFLLSTV